MGYNKELARIKVNYRLNDMFVKIIQDIPNSELNPRSNTLTLPQKNRLMSYDQFYKRIYMIVLDYIPSENENPLFKAIKMLPRAIKNTRRIKQNIEIIKFQQEILDKYFYTQCDDNIKEKLSELKNAVNQLIDNDDFEILDDVLSRFDERMRSGLLSDLIHLSQLLEQRIKI